MIRPIEMQHSRQSNAAPQSPNLVQCLGAIAQITMAERHIRGIAVVLQYALQQAEEDEDGGPAAVHLGACMSIIDVLCDDVKSGVGELHAFIDRSLE